MRLDRSRLAKLRQKQEWSFTPVFLHRPLAILLLIPLADVRAITPNRVTVASILLRVIAAALMWPAAWHGMAESTTKLVVIVVLWHVGGVLDAADGALARYRGQSSGFGRYLDKVSDRLLTLVLVLALVARACVATGSVVFALLGLLYVALLSATSVAKWIDLGVRNGLPGNTETTADPSEVAAPTRTPLQWLKFIALRSLSIFIVDEMDLPLWGSVALVLGREDWLLWYLAILAVPYSLGAVALRGYGLWRDERRTLAGR